MKIAELGLSDRGRLLILLNAASEGQVIIYRELLDGYVWLINERKILPFYCPFTMAIFPYSGELREKLRVSIGSREVRNGFHVWITQATADWVSAHIKRTLDFEEVKGRILKEYVYITSDGKKWVSKTVEKASDFEEITKSLIEQLKLFASWERDQLFQVICDTVKNP